MKIKIIFHGRCFLTQSSRLWVVLQVAFVWCTLLSWMPKKPCQLRLGRTVGHHRENQPVGDGWPLVIVELLRQSDADPSSTPLQIFQFLGVEGSHQFDRRKRLVKYRLGGVAWTIGTWLTWELLADAKSNCLNVLGWTIQLEWKGGVYQGEAILFWVQLWSFESSCHTWRSLDSESAGRVSAGFRSWCYLFEQNLDCWLVDLMRIHEAVPIIFHQHVIQPSIKSQRPSAIFCLTDFICGIWRHLDLTEFYYHIPTSSKFSLATCPAMCKALLAKLERSWAREANSRWGRANSKVQ